MRVLPGTSFRSKCLNKFFIMLTNSKMISKRVLEASFKSYLVGNGFIPSPVAEGYQDGTLNNLIQGIYLRQREISKLESALGK